MDREVRPAQTAWSKEAVVLRGPAFALGAAAGLPAEAPSGAKAGRCEMDMLYPELFKSLEAVRWNLEKDIPWHRYDASRLSDASQARTNG